MLEYFLSLNINWMIQSPIESISYQTEHFLRIHDIFQLSTKYSFGTFAKSFRSALTWLASLKLKTETTHNKRMYHQRPKIFS